MRLESVLFKMPRPRLPPALLSDSDGDGDGITTATATASQRHHNGITTPEVSSDRRGVDTLVLAWCGMEEQGLDPCDNRWSIDVHAPRLRSFVYKGHIRPFELRSSTSAAPPDTARVDLHFPRDGPYRRYHYWRGDGKESTPALFWQFLRNFASARTLKLRVGDDLKDIAVAGEARRAKLLCAFPNAERLELEGVHRRTSKTAAVAIACCGYFSHFL